MLMALKIWMGLGLVMVVLAYLFGTLTTLRTTPGKPTVAIKTRPYATLKKAA